MPAPRWPMVGWSPMVGGCWSSPRSPTRSSARSRLLMRPQTLSSSRVAICAATSPVARSRAHLKRDRPTLFCGEIALSVEAKQIPAPDGEKIIADAVAALRAGGLVIYSTETFFGIAAAPESAAALEKIFALKGREPGKPIALIAADTASAFSLAR